MHHLLPPFLSAVVVAAAALTWWLASRAGSGADERSLCRGSAGGTALAVSLAAVSGPLVAQVPGASRQVAVCALTAVAVTGTYLVQHAGINAWHESRAPRRRGGDRHELLTGLAAVLIAQALMNAVALALVVAHSALVGADGLGRPPGTAAEGSLWWWRLQPRLALLAVAVVGSQALLTVARARGQLRDPRVHLLVLASACVGAGAVSAASHATSSTGTSALATTLWLMALLVVAAASALPADGGGRPVQTSDRAATVGAFSILLVAVAVLAATSLGLGPFLGRPTSEPASSVPVQVTIAGAALAAGLTSWRLLLNLRHLTRSEHAEDLAHTDELTGLSNRRGLLHALQVACEEGTAIGLALIDLDRFKEINDGLGHAAGDELLRQVSSRLTALASRGAAVRSRVLARLGGDEFVVLVSTQQQDVEAAVLADPGEAARRWGQAMVGLFEAPFTVAGVVVHVRASVGVSVSPGEVADVRAATAAGGAGELVARDTSARTPSELLRRVDAAMYAAKSGHDTTTRAVVYDPDHHDRATTRRVLAEDLRAAIATRTLEVHFQPQLTARTGRLAGLEALVRWHHPQHGWVPAGEVVDVAERYGLMTSLTDLVLDLAIGCASGWDARFPPSAVEVGWHLSVNLSASSLLDEALDVRIQQLLDAHAVPASRLVVEVTESVLVSDLDRSLQVLDRLRRLGVQVSIDDFGTGYSSLTQLASLPAQELKLDRAFTQQLGTDPRADAVVAASIDLAHRLQMRVVAEGVEDAGALRTLVELGCDRTQGHLHSRALPPEELLAWTRAHGEQLAQPVRQER